MKHRILALLLALTATAARAQAPDDPAAEPAVRAVARTMPAVVNIATEAVVRRTLRDPADVLFESYFGGPMRPPRMIKQKVQSLGSGFFVDASGHLITNAHVVARAAEMKITVTTQDGRTLDARYITGDPDHDLALLKVETKDPLPFISLGELSPNLPGQTCLVLGNPLGYGSSVARGILSATGRTVTVGDTEYQNLLQTDAAINPGNSGGPIVDLAGRLIGVSSVKMSYTPDGLPTQGLGFAIPASVVREKLDEFQKIARGEKLPDRPSLARQHFGLGLQDLDERLAASLGFRPGTGALIADIEKDSPAAQAGLRPGALITTIGRYEITSTSQIEKLFKQIAPGSRVDIGISWWEGRGRTQRLHSDTIRLRAR